MIIGEAEAGMSEDTTMRAEPAEYEMVSISALRELPGNARTHPEEQLEALEESIRNFGWLVPVLVDATGTIVAGHGRLEAARRLGLTEIPCLRAASEWDEETKRAYSVADNRIAELSSWDMTAVRKELDYLQKFGFEEDMLHGLKVPAAAPLISERSDPPAGATDMPHRDTVELECENCHRKFEVLV